jgi:uncharacterized protein (TIGR02687 family)
MLEEIKDLLVDTLSKENTNGRTRKIIFWYDDKHECLENIDDLCFDNTEIIKYDNNSSWIKYHIEFEELNKNIIIYFPFSMPENKENSLLDIQCYNSEYIFNPDSTTMILKNLGLKEDCRSIIKKYSTFFGNMKRESKFKEFDIVGKDYTNIDYIIIAILLGVKSINLDDILKALIKDFYEGSKKIEELEKFGDINKLFEIINSSFGSNIKSVDELDYLFKGLVFTQFVSSLKPNNEDKISKYSRYIFKQYTNCYVFINSLMRDKAYKKYYDLIANETEKEFGIPELVNQMTNEDVINSDAFISIDKHYIKYITDVLLTFANQFDSYKGYINSRKNKYWYEYLENEYKTIENAIYFLEKYEEVENEIKTYEFNKFIQVYIDKLSDVDKFYRKFYSYYDSLKEKDIFMELKDKIENIYVNKYISDLSIKWSESISDVKQYGEESLLQSKFYNKYIKPYDDRKDRIIVVVSDALRFECAKELHDKLNLIGGKSNLEYMLGVVPSYTKLGMASLLPNKELRRADKDDILVDGMKSSSIIDRENILKNANELSLALKYDDLYDMTKQEWKQKFSGKKIVFIYHDSIDAIGDHSATENEVFTACDKAILELQKLVEDLHRTFSGTNVFITADHGFFYKRGKLSTTDKISKDREAEINKLRYSYSDKPNVAEGIISIDLSYIFGENSGYVNVPKGNMVYQRQGSGLNYVHGGIMPQEIIIPVIDFKSSRGKDDVKKVNIAYSGLTSKITNAITYLNFMQTERMDENTKACRYLVHFVDEAGIKVSDQCTIVANLADENIKSRIFEEKFVFKNIAYDKNKIYYLVITDEETGIVKDKVNFYIDIAIVNDFGF